MDAQAGLRLCCSQTPEDRFFRVEAHIVTVNGDSNIESESKMQSIVKECNLPQPRSKSNEKYDCYGGQLF